MSFRIITCLSVGCLLLAGGCQANRFGCGSCWNGIGNARVAPPGTYSYSTNANQPYYTPNTAAAQPGAGYPVSTPPGTPLNSQMVQPNTATGGQPVNPAPSQWHGADASQPSSSSYYGQTYQPAPTNYNPTSYTVSGSGQRDFQTTVVDERTDPTRMPATDATGVRAPANFAQTANWQMMPRTVVVPGTIEYQANPQIVGNQPGSSISYPTLPSGYPNMAAPNNAGNYVLAQSSTTNVPNDPNYLLGWRQPDPNQQTTRR